METEAREIVRQIDFEKIKDHPNILIAARFWDDDRYHAAKTCYKFMRMIDDMIDQRKADAGTINCMEKRLFIDKVNTYIECLNGMGAGDPLLEEIVATLNTFKIPLKLFHTFARSMIHDINHDGFRTFDEFLDYSEGASVSPASVFVHLCCLGRINGSYIEPPYDIVEVARPCAIFSYIVHIIRDFQKDQHDNLNYFPKDMLDKHHLVPDDLKKIARGGKVPDSFRNLIKEYCGYAEVYRRQTLDQIKRLMPLLAPRYLLSLHIIYNLYLQVYERIDPESGRFTTSELNPSPAELHARVLSVIEVNHTA
jgi:phytoene synthase